mmetsp:Transcript_46697/g.117538  ORF Transcript_46697/g.117538 Transcript_46697/m.117538 type:complete len:471 (-) Transcript_46697:134-1546(-)
MATHVTRASLFVGILVLSQGYLADSARLASHGVAEQSCIGCGKYPEAPDYSDGLDDEDDFLASLEQLEEELHDTIKDLDPEKPEAPVTIAGKLGPIQKVWNYLMDAIFRALQGQTCMSLCALCVPKLEELAQQMSKDAVALKSVFIERNKNWQALSVFPVLGPVDSVLGGVFSILHGLPLAILSFFAGGTVVGAGTGVAVSGATSDSIGSMAGNLLGLLAGISTGVVSAGVLFSGVEIVHLLKGFYKGLNIVAKLTDCKRVGFETNVNGQGLEEQPWETDFGSSDYGMKKLRRWTNESSAEDGDFEAMKHCERIREHSFDMRHATECVKHSQICGGPGLLMPAMSEKHCRSISEAPLLERMAVQWGEGAERRKTAFSAWRLVQEVVKSKTKWDGKKEQCRSMLCEFGGLAAAEEKFSPDAVKQMDIPETEKVQYKNIVVFLAACASEYNLELNDVAARDVACKEGEARED